MAQALSDEREPLPERLVREALRQRLREIGHRQLVRDQAVDERRRDGIAADLRRDRLREPRRDGFVAPEDGRDRAMNTNMDTSWPMPPNAALMACTPSPTARLAQ